MMRQLHHFVSIVDNGGISNAAKALNLSQPALSRSLQALEFNLDAQLIERGRGNPVLTEVGRMLLSRARMLLAEQSNLHEDVRALQRRVGEVAYVNGSPAIAVNLLTRTIIEVARLDPALRISVRGDNGTNYEWKTEALRAGDIDVAVSIPLPFSNDEPFVQEALLEPTLKVVMPEGDSQCAATSLAELLDRRWILPPRATSGRGVIENEFQLCGLELPRDTVEISEWRMALALARAGGGITVIPYHPACFGKLRGLTMLPIDFHTRPLHLNLIYRRQVGERPAAKAFMQAIRSLVAAAETTQRQSTH